MGGNLLAILMHGKRQKKFAPKVGGEDYTAMPMGGSSHDNSFLEVAYFGTWMRPAHLASADPPHVAGRGHISS